MAAAIPVLETLAIDAAVTGPQGLVIAGGLILVAGILYYVHKGDVVEETKVRQPTKDKERFEPCCCGMMHRSSDRGPSGKFKVHFIMKNSRKEAEEAARHYGGADGVEHHPSNTHEHDKYPHYHPTKNGQKISGIHFQYPK